MLIDRRGIADRLSSRILRTFAAMSLASATLCTSTARADITVLTADFECPNYNLGSVIGQGGWTGNSGVVQSTLANSVPGSARALQLAGSGFPNNNPPQAADFAVNIPVAGGQIVTFAADMYRLGAQGSSCGLTISSDAGLIGQTADQGGTTYLVSFFPISSPSVFTDGVWRRVVLTANFGNNTISATVNGVSIGTLPITTPSTPTRVTTLSLYSYGAPNGTMNAYFDNVSITTSRPINDACAFAAPIALGSTSLDTTAATTDGPAHAACNINGSNAISNDLWYTHVPAASGQLTVSTCGSAFNTRIAVYSSTTCPPTDAALMNCNDNALSCGTSSLQSSATVSVNAGQTYLIRVGGFPTSNSSGLGTLTLSATTTGACCNRWTGNCVLDTLAGCSSRGLRFDGVGTVCSPSTCRPCPADFDGSGGLALQDIFSMLNAWFAGCP